MVKDKISLSVLIKIDFKDEIDDFIEIYFHVHIGL